jgi:hypothetical protein
VFVPRRGEPAGEFDAIDIAFDNANRGQIVWVWWIDSTPTVWTTSFVGSSWRPAQLLSAPLGNGVSPVIAAAGNGAAFASWGMLGNPAPGMIAQFR